MLKTLGDEGYLIEWRVVNAAEYGFAQRRIRVFIVARHIKKTLPKSWKLDPFVEIYKTGILARALPIVQDKQKFEEIDLHDEADVISKDFNKGASKSPFLNSGIYLDGIAHTVKSVAVKAKTANVLGDVILPDSEIPAEYWVSKDKLAEWKYLKGAKSIERTHAGGGTYNYTEGSMAFPDLLTNPSRTILTGEGGTSPSRFKHIIKTDKGYRRLLPIELERLNGFPDDWTQTDANGGTISDVRRSFFMGNALVIGLIEKVGKVIANEISK
jgi:DNA (cytosine-5)-methyltransferase 1